MLVSAFKASLEITSLPLTVLPKKLTLENFAMVFREIPLVRAFINSMIVAGIVTASVLITSSLAGFLFAKMKFKGNDVLFIFSLSSLLFPPYIVLIPLLLMASKMHVINTYIGLVFPYLFHGFGIFLLRQFIMGIPDSLIDAARIDGATDFKIYRQIILPLTRPILSVLAILFFLWTYNDFLWPLVVVSTEKMKTVSILLAHFTMAQQDYPGPSMAASTLVIVPVLIVYSIFQRNFIKGFTMTGMKS
jgi:multiple sugar transport system permease protein